MSRTVVPADVFDPEAGVLFGSRCATCGTVHFPPINGCPDCFAASTDRVPLSPTGRVRSFTVVNLGFAGFPQGYPLVEVELPEGIVVLGQLAGVDDPGQLYSGMVVKVEAGPVRVAEDGEAMDGYRFAPVGEEG